MTRHGRSRSSSQRGSPPTAEAGALGLQRSISHRQMSLGSRPSSESLQAGGGSTQELPRLPGEVRVRVMSRGQGQDWCMVRVEYQYLGWLPNILVYRSACGSHCEHNEAAA